MNFNICEVQLNICKTLPNILQLCITSPDFIIIILVLDAEHKKLALIFIVLQADILTMKHGCDVIMMQTRHSDGDTITVYDTASVGLPSLEIRVT